MASRNIDRQPQARKPASPAGYRMKNKLLSNAKPGELQNLARLKPKAKPRASVGGVRAATDPRNTAKSRKALGKYGK